MANTKVIENKQAVVEELKGKIDLAKVLVLSDYRGFTVQQITELRRKLLKQKSEYRVIKNTLLKRALAAAGFTGLDAHLSGPTGLLIGYDDPVLPLKTLVEHVEEIEKGELRVGLVEKQLVDAKGIAVLSKLPPREVLIAKVVGGFKAPLYGLVNALQGNIRKLVYALNAVKEKKGG